MANYAKIEQGYVNNEISRFEGAFPDVDDIAKGVIRLMVLEAFRAGYRVAEDRLRKGNGYK